jgi:exopolysaccharide production protein ExoZ
VPSSSEFELLNAPPVPAPGGSAKPKLMHLQILRAVAASCVVVDHAFVLLHNAGFPCAQYNHPGYLIGHSGVAAFFVLSGLIMVRQSDNLFGRRWSPLLFAWRRVTRIVPMYWIATLLWAAIFWTNEAPHPKRQILYSLLFIPNYLAGHTRLFPVLQLGWTLNYEMFFYLIFCAALFLRRKTGIVMLLVVPVVLVAIGYAHTFPDDQSLPSLLSFYTNPFLLLFVLGVLIAVIETRQPRISWPVSPAFLLLFPAVLFLVFPLTLGAYDLYESLSIYSTLIVLLCALVRYKAPGTIGRTLVLLGDSSYSTYLFHPMILPLVIGLALRTYGSRTKSVGAAMVLVLACIVLANIFGLLIHLAVERPLIRAFRRFNFGADNKLQPQASGVEP